LKQALSSTGLLFGLQRCINPTCARAYANGLTEHDAKQPKLCAACDEAFAKRFGK
jgi:predicted Zn-dependent protease